MRLSSSKIKKYNKIADKKPVMVRVDHVWYTWLEGDQKSVFLTTQNGKDIEFDYNRIDDIQESTTKITKSQLREIIREEIQKNKPKKQILEIQMPKFVPPSDVSYYGKHWGDIFEELGKYRTIHFGPTESDMYDWNDRSHYENVTKEYHAHMSKVATKLNSVIKEFGDSWKVWYKILKKYRNKDRS